MVLKSFSKINLTLNIFKKFKKNNLHDIQSYFCLINLFDLIKIKKNEGQKDIIKFKGKFSKYIKKKRQLNYKYSRNIKGKKSNFWLLLSFDK